MSEEETKIEPYYQIQGKQLVDILFDKGLLSENLSRGGMDRVEDLVALMFQQHANIAKRNAKFIKLYKGQERPEGQERHEEEMRWIARAKEAEARVRELESAGICQTVKVGGDAAAWALKVGVFLKKALEPPWGLSDRGSFMEASRLFTDAIKLGVIPEPDCMPGKIILTKPPRNGMPGEPLPGEE